ncbi:MAG: hypothetical protein MUC52_01000 [Candidatus Omnitrophica bacterium]|jgi:hypothetical protein|nr:hypothetical protein [Candidatus Omnitrophota bacterium]
MLKKMALVCVFLICAAGNVGAQDVNVEFEGRYWMPDLTAKAKVTEAGIIGSNLNFKSELGIKDEDFPEARFIWHTGPNSRIRAFYTQAEFDGDQTVSQTITFDGKTYTAGAQVKSNLDLQYFGLGWIWEFINTMDEKVKIGTILEAKGFAGEASLDAPALSISESTDFIAGLPTAGLSFTVNPFKDSAPYKSRNMLTELSFYGEAAGMSAGTYGYFLDAEAGVKWAPVKNVSVSGGYRMVSMKAEDDPDYAKLELKGWFAGCSIRF